MPSAALSLILRKKGFFFGAGGASIRGWTGLEDCGGDFTYRVDIQNDGGTEYGFNQVFGNNSPNTLDGLLIYSLTVDTATNEVLIRMGDLSTSRFELSSQLNLEFYKYGSVVPVVWDDVRELYVVADAALTTYISGIDGESITYNLTQEVVILVDSNGDELTDDNGNVLVV